MSRYNVSISADSRVITRILDAHGYLVDREASHAAAAAHPSRTTYFYPVEGESSADVIDRVFDELEGAGAKPADAVRVSVRPVEAVKP